MFCSAMLYASVNTDVFFLGEQLPLLRRQVLVDFLIAPLVPEQVDIAVAWQLLERQHGHDIFALPVAVRSAYFAAGMRS